MLPSIKKIKHYEYFEYESSEDNDIKLSYERD